MLTQTSDISYFMFMFSCFIVCLHRNGVQWHQSRLRRWHERCSFMYEIVMFDRLSRNSEDVTVLIKVMQNKAYENTWGFDLTLIPLYYNTKVLLSAIQFFHNDEPKLLQRGENHFESGHVEDCSYISGRFVGQVRASYEQKGKIHSVLVSVKVSQQYLNKANKLLSRSNQKVKSWRKEAEPHQRLSFIDQWNHAWNYHHVSLWLVASKGIELPPP